VGCGKTKEEEIMTRSPQDVFKHHLDALSRRDVGALITDYAANATILTQQGAMQGTEGAEQFYRQAFEVLPDAEFAVQWSVFAGDTLMAGWTATATAGHIHNGVDTLSFRDGLISLHASSFTIEPR
jgi:hypothetical protein